MKYRKIAKDKNGTILQEGDIITYNNGEVIQCVIDRINQPSREMNPDLEVFEVTTDWKGNGLSTKKNTLPYDTYRDCVLMKSEFISNTSPKYTKLNQLAEKAYSRMAFRRRVEYDD